MSNMTTNVNSKHTWPKQSVAWYAVIILTLAFMVSFIDRMLLGLFIQPIKEDLGLSDSEMGVIAGVSFFLFYAIFGIPFGRLADKYSRRLIIGIGITIWCLMTAASAFAQGFWSLFFLRAGIGLGEAALSPAAYSLFSDYFPPSKLGRAIGVYQAGAYFGIGTALLLGGGVAEFVHGLDLTNTALFSGLEVWRVTFLMIGLPGLILALLMTTILEPKRSGMSSINNVTAADVFRYVSGHKATFVCLFLGFALLLVPVTTLSTWGPTYLIRVFDLSVAEAGYAFGLVFLLLSPVGVFVGGWFGDALIKRGYADGMLRVGVIAALFVIPLTVFAMTRSTVATTLMVMCVLSFVASFSSGIGPASLQIIAPNRMRGLCSALFVLVLSLVAISGPMVVGLVTDYVFANEAMLGHSIIIAVVIPVFLAGTMLVIGLGPYRRTFAKFRGSKTSSD